LDKTIITALLLIAGLITAVVLFNAIYPAVVESSDAMNLRQKKIEERFSSQIEIIHVTGDGTYSDVALAWVKNIGSSRIAAVENCDVFFGPEGNFARIPFGTGDPGWTYVVENDDEWNSTATVKLTINVDYNLVSGEVYFIKVVTPNGISDEYFFSE
jgi:flagellar protein FlaG